MKVYKLASYFCSECHAELLPYTKEGDTTNIFFEHQEHPECSQAGTHCRLRLAVHEMPDLKQVVIH